MVPTYLAQIKEGGVDVGTFCHSRASVASAAVVLQHSAKVCGVNHADFVSKA